MELKSSYGSVSVDIKDKNGSFFNEVVINYQRSLQSVSYNVIYSEEDAKDIVQESFLSFYNNIENFKGESSIFTYLYRIVLNKSIDHLRKNKTKRVIDGEIENIETKSDVIKNIDTKIIVTDALKKLDVNYRIPLILLEYENKSYDEIAKILNISLDNVKIKIYRAREMLLKILKKMGVYNVNM